MTGPLAINDVVYAELSVRYASIAELDAMLSGLNLQLEPIPRSALFAVAKAFMQYQTRGGVRSGVLPDFFIGAHASSQDWPLLTRDATRYRDYFPAIRLIVPD